MAIFYGETRKGAQRCAQTSVGAVPLLPSLASAISEGKTDRRPALNRVSIDAYLWDTHSRESAAWKHNGNWRVTATGAAGFTRNQVTLYITDLVEDQDIYVKNLTFMNTDTPDVLALEPLSNPNPTIGFDIEDFWPIGSTTADVNIYSIQTGSTWFRWPCFYDYDRNGDGVHDWKLRFAPTKTGSWEYKIEVRYRTGSQSEDPIDVVQMDVRTFNCTTNSDPITGRGFLRKDSIDYRFFSFSGADFGSASDDLPFYPMGVKCDSTADIVSLADNGGGTKWSILKPLANFLSRVDLRGLTQESYYPVSDPLHPTKMLISYDSDVGIFGFRGSNKAYLYVKNLTNTWYYAAGFTDHISAPTAQTATITVKGLIRRNIYH